MSCIYCRGEKNLAFEMGGKRWENVVSVRSSDYIFCPVCGEKIKIGGVNMENCKVKENCIHVYYREGQCLVCKNYNLYYPDDKSIYPPVEEAETCTN